MDKVLIAQNDSSVGGLIEAKLRNEMGMAPHWVKTLGAARDALASSSNYDIALLDLELPDAQGTDIVDLVAKHKIPMLVFSKHYTREQRDTLMQKGVIDYVIKETPDSVNDLFASLCRVLLNRKRTVLVVEDSGPIRKLLKDILKRFQLNVVAAKDGAEALALFEKRPEISLVITDYSMPHMNGLELTKAIKGESNERRVAVIALSSVTDTDIRIQFIKSGAADFLTKPFEIEELFCRVSQNLNILDQLETLHRQANNDFLTGLYNRRYFFETAKSKLAQASRSGEPCAVMLFDIDNFKAVNDTYGHETGDRVLIGFAERLAQSTREADVLSRFGGEEFCKLLIAPNPDSLIPIAENVLARIGETPFTSSEGDIPITASIGIAYGTGVGLDKLIETADMLLYQAKRTGRNRALIGKAPDGLAPALAEGPAGVDKPYVKHETKNFQELWR